MINLTKICAIATVLIGVVACSTTDAPTKNATATSTPAITYAMDVTDIDYGSVQTDRRYLVSYSFPDDQGRFAVRASAQGGVSEPVTDTTDYAFVHDDVANSVICKSGIRKLNAKPDYLVADRAYQTAYICTNSEG